MSGLVSSGLTFRDMSGNPLLAMPILQYCEQLSLWHTQSAYIDLHGRHLTCREHEIVAIHVFATVFEHSERPLVKQMADTSSQVLLEAQTNIMVAA